MRTSYTEGELLTKEDIGLVFKSRDQQQWRIVGILDTEFFPVLIINFKNIHAVRLSINGRDRGDGDIIVEKEVDLVSFIGPDFIEDKKTRKFEFKCYLGEKITDKPHPDFPLEMEIGCQVSHPQTIKDYLNFPKISKWKITMEEIIDEN